MTDCHSTMSLICKERQWKMWMSAWLILSICVLIISINFNWAHWGNVALVNDDVHREFVTPLRLGQGEVLYKNFNFLYGPLPQYLNAWIIKTSFLNVFTTLRILAVLLFSVNLLFLWLICKDIDLPWIFGPILLGILCWTSCYTFNPTSFNGIYATMFSTLSIWCAIRALKGGKWPWYIMGIACAFTLFSKPEGVFIAGLATAGAYIYLVCHGKTFFYIKSVLIWVSGLISLSVPVLVYLFYQGLSWSNIVEGLLQKRFQENLSLGFISQYNYFYGINHVLVIVAGCACVALIFYLIRLYQIRRRIFFWFILIAVGIVATYLTVSGQLIRLFNDFQNLGDFFGGILGYWWYKQIPGEALKKGFFVVWLSSFGGWLRPLFHIGAIVIPFRVGGGMLLAVIFWFLILPSLYQKIFSGIENSAKRISNIFLIAGSVGVLVFGITGLYYSWDTQWRHPTIEFKTQYGSFLANSDAESTQVGSEVIRWLRDHLNEKERIVALEGLPIELVMGQLPCIPLSQLSYQVYNEDTEKITSILNKRDDIKYVLVQIRHGGYHFGIQDYKLADYLDNNWKQVKRFRIPDQLGRLSQMSAKRKIDCSLVKGFIVFGRRTS